MLKEFFDELVFDVLAVDPGSAAGQALHFFLYDSVKILILLYLMIAAVGVVRTYIPQSSLRQYMGGGKKTLSYLVAAASGALTPFCSCSSIPIFISLLRAGVPLGPAFTFLTTSPLINEYLAVLMLGFFGWKITAAYILFGALLGIASGLAVSHMRMEGQLVEDIVAGDDEQEESFSGFGARLRFGFDEAAAIVRRLWKWVLLGVGVGALIHGYVPEKLIEDSLARAGPLSVPLAAILGVPIYANCSAVVPIALVLFMKGVPLGTALAFMMATAALSIPEAVILRRAMRVRLIILFFALVAAGIIIVGYAFNALEATLAI